MRVPLLKNLKSQLGEYGTEKSEYMGMELVTYTGTDAEVIMLTDDKQTTIGKKRNILKALAKGDYIVFADDDDWTSDDYIPQIIAGAATNPDCVVFGFEMYDKGVKKYDVHYSRRNSDYNSDSKGIAFRRPNHMMAYRARIAKRVMFPEKNFGEDSAFAKRASGFISTQVRVEKVLYRYMFSEFTTEAQKFLFQK